MGEQRRVAIVTGAGSGIGLHVAHTLLNTGYLVALAGRREAPLRSTVTTAATGGERTLVVPTDVSNPLAVDELFSRVRREWGRIDLLFNNAGVFGPQTPIDEISFAQWQAVVATNLSGMFLCAQAAFRTMKGQQPRGGRIINNGSISAHSPRPQRVAYTATKHAITGLTKAVALEGRDFDIACGQIDIGNADTGLIQHVNDGTARGEPTMDVRHAAEAVLYMASLPLEANVQFLTVMATTMPYIGRG